MNTRSVSNRAWILKAFDQMVEAKFAMADDFEATLCALIERLKAEGASKETVNLLFQELRVIPRPVV